MNIESNLLMFAKTMIEIAKPIYPIYSLCDIS